MVIKNPVMGEVGIAADDGYGFESGRKNSRKHSVIRREISSLDLLNCLLSLNVIEFSSPHHSYMSDVWFREIEIGQRKCLSFFQKIIRIKKEHERGRSA
jgi:hypothetical protein